VVRAGWARFGHCACGAGGLAHAEPSPGGASLLGRCSSPAPCRAWPQGYDAAAHVLACFGGAGGQHACAIARALGMRTIFVHRCGAARGQGAAAAGPAAAWCLLSCLPATLHRHPASHSPLHRPPPILALALSPSTPSTPQPLNPCPAPTPARRYAGILSAVGIHIADIVHEAQEPAAVMLGPEALPALEARLNALAAAAADKLGAQVRGCRRGCRRSGPAAAGPGPSSSSFQAHQRRVLQLLQLPTRCTSPAHQHMTGTHRPPACLPSPPQGFSPSQVQVERFLNLRYSGTDVAVMTPCPAPGSGASYGDAFAASYRCGGWWAGGGGGAGKLGGLGVGAWRLGSGVSGGLAHQEAGA
jgi:hypothetical protein